MPRPRLPLTPSASTDITAQKKDSPVSVEGAFALPPPALRSSAKKPSHQKHSSQSSGRMNPPNSPPPSPGRPVIESTLQRKRTLSGASKTKSETTLTSPPSQQHTQHHTLPPPPSRARKIIQMKPKQSSSTVQEQTMTPQSSSNTSKPATVPSPSATKQKKAPSNTAAGRKIARKTAHSIIERRRRSKMNEEFAVLKDMIPACVGVEMHKLAILQAGIDYLRYLEGCVKSLKEQNGRMEVVEENEDTEDHQAMDTDDPGEAYQDENDTTASVNEDDSTLEQQASQNRSLPHQHRHTSVTTSTCTSTYASPDLKPINSSSSLNTASMYRYPPSSSHSYEQLPQLRHPNVSYQTSSQSVSNSPRLASDTTPTGVSPAFQAFNFNSPDFSRTSTWTSTNNITSATGASRAHRSPSIQPLPQAALPFPEPRDPQTLSSSGEGHAEATATAALMMLTKDRRSSVSLPSIAQGNGSAAAAVAAAAPRRPNGMSVRDLLSS